MGLGVRHMLRTALPQAGNCASYHEFTEMRREGKKMMHIVESGILAHLTFSWKPEAVVIDGMLNVED